MVELCLIQYSWSSSPQFTRNCIHFVGTMDIHTQVEKLVAEFIGVEDSITFGMGFATNALNIPILAGKGTLIIRYVIIEYVRYVGLYADL